MISSPIKWVGGVQVLHVHHTHPDYGKIAVGAALPPEHPHARAAHAPQSALRTAA